MSKTLSFETGFRAASKLAPLQSSAIIAAAPESIISGAKPAGYPSAKVYSALNSTWS
ncbi:MAG: hypothetical protein IKN82_01020 [Treponema sp.]|nr:hypothetical protein [Treponema sp.]